MSNGKREHIEMATDTELGRLSKQWNRLFAMASTDERPYQYLRHGMQTLIEGVLLRTDENPRNSLEEFEELIKSLLDDPVQASGRRVPADTAAIMFVANGAGCTAATIVAEAFSKLSDAELVEASAIFLEGLLICYRLRKDTEPFIDIIQEVLEGMTWEDPLSGSSHRDKLKSSRLPVEFRNPLADAAVRVLAQQREEQAAAQRDTDTAVVFS